MSFATEMLVAAQSAYKNALNIKSHRLNGRGEEKHDIAVLRAEVEHWQKQVNAETARATGKPVYQPIQIVI